ncbi:MAG: hypothetical protein JSR31_01870 [Nitrospira sp.]|nr:hypothetical protein [Nitrospira sp.]
MICSRCQGMMVSEDLRDGMSGRGYDCSYAWRCVMCGEIVDSVIRDNRKKMQEVGLDGRMKRGRHYARTLPAHPDRSEVSRSPF